MFVKRVYPDAKIQDAIKKVAAMFHEKLEKVIAEYAGKTKNLIPTERIAREISL